MDKNIIKKHLTERFLKEEDTPGISVTNAAKKQSEKINKDAMKDVEKQSKDYSKSLKQDDVNTSKMAQNKFNYTDDAEKTYHDEMEIMNGQEMIQYDRNPNKMFKERAKEAIEGSSRMGNNPEWANVIPAQQGFTGPDFGKNLVKKVEASTKKRAEAEDNFTSLGDDIETIEGKSKKGPMIRGRHSALSEGETEENNNKSQIKETMKRIKFKNEFNGLGNALKLIPESYKVNNKVFEMTDGNETYKIRWEGTLTEGKAVVLTAADKTLVNEDITRMKQLFGYKSQETLGLVKGKARIDENKVFGDIWNKTKTLLEGEDTMSQAPEAKKHVEGSVATDKKTEANASEGHWEEVDINAPEATEHVEGSVATDKKTEAKASEGHLEDAVSYAPEAKKHVMNEAVEDEDEGDDDDKSDDSWYKGDDDDSSDEKEPTGGEIKGDVPSLDTDDDEEEVIVAPKKSDMSLMMSPSSGDYFIVDATGARTKVPAEYLEIASNKSLGTGAKRAEMIMAKMSEDSDNM